MKKFLICMLIVVMLLAVGCNEGENTSSGNDLNSNNGSSIENSVSIEGLDEDQKVLLKINNYATTPVKEINVERKIIQAYDSYWDYNHQPAIAIFKGKIYVAYANGHDGEGNCGQRIMITSSSDFKNWSKPVPLVDTTKGYYSNISSSPIGLYATKDKLVAYCMSGEYKPESLQGENKRPATDGHSLWQKMYIKTTTDGVNWSKAEVFGDGTLIASPRVTSGGRLIMPSSNGYAYTDDLNGLKDWKFNHFEGYDETVFAYGGLQDGRYSESSWYEYDGYIYLLCRTGTQYMAGARSKDNGKTWSKPQLTSFSENTTKFAFTTLPNGKIAYVGTPDLDGYRATLKLCISSNGIDFNDQYMLGDERYTIKTPGFAKQGDYGYPAICTDDEYLYAVYSRGKEILEICRVKLSDLD